MAERKYDLVLFGATGFTGGLTAEYLAANGPEGLSWALLGRNRGKHFLGWRRPRHEHRDPAQDGLFVGEPGTYRPLAYEKARVGEGDTGLMRQRAGPQAS